MATVESSASPPCSTLTQYDRHCPTTSLGVSLVCLMASLDHLDH